MAGRVVLEVGRGRRKGQQGGPRAGRGMRILILGDFGGEGKGAGGPLEVDVDRFDDVLRRVSPRVRLEEADPGSEVVFECLEDFHPDALFRRLGLFRGLEESRLRLLERATFAEESARLWPAAEPGGPAPSRAGAPGEDSAATIERLLGRKPEGAAPPVPPAQEAVSRLLKEAVAPHVVPSAPLGQQECVARVEEAMGDRTRSVLHAAAFRALEAAWRSVHGLVSNLEAGEDLRLYLLDVSKAEVTRLLGEEGPARGQTLTGEGAPDGEGWSLLVGDYRFGPGAEDMALLEAAGGLAFRIGAPFLAAVGPDLLGCRSVSDLADPSLWSGDPEREGRWRALRRSASARWIGLALPGVLLRLPYGARSDPVESFPFEEVQSPHEPAAYLWGNPAFAAARLLAESHLERGWEMEPGDRLELGDLPAFVYEWERERKLRPCTEVRLPERAAEEILARGLMPLLAHASRNALRLLRFQSIADPPAPLSGPWG